MKAAIVSLLLISSIANACPNFSGVYVGTCKFTIQGEESIEERPMAISQVGCDKFNFNDFTNNFYTLGKSTLYAGGERKYLKRALLSDDGKELSLHQTVERNSEKFGNSLAVSTYVFKRLSDTNISYDGETFDLLKGEVSVTTSCPNLKKGE